MTLRFAAVSAAFCLAGLAAPAFAGVQDICPSVKVDKEAGRLADYPGGAPGRDKLDYAFIAVVLSAEAVCREDDNDNIVADITITFALEPGPLYQGLAEAQLFASVTEGGNVTDRQVTASKAARPAKGSGPVTLTVTATGLVLGDEDTVEAGGVGIAAGFVKKAVQP